MALTLQRQERVERVGSPFFDINIGTLNSGNAYILDLDSTSPYSKYSPYDFIEITNNNSSANLTVTINGGGHTIFVPAQTIKSLTKKGIRHIKITTSANITSGEVRIGLERQPIDADEWARRQALSLFNSIKNLLPLGLILR
jgi:hypothetical protein